MGCRVAKLSRCCRPADPDIRIRPFPRDIVTGSDSGVLPGGPITGAGHCRAAWAEETAGAVYTSGWRGAVGVWVLF